MDIQAQLRLKAKEVGPGQWITGRGWDEASLKENRNPTRKDLDVATPNNPVVLVRAGGSLECGQFAGPEGWPASRVPLRTRNRGSSSTTRTVSPTASSAERSDLYTKLVPRDTWADMKPTYAAMLHHLLSCGAHQHGVGLGHARR